jgi:fumarate hydratase class I
MSETVRNLRIPLVEADVRALHVGDTVHLSGTIYTGRDAFHQRAHALLPAELPFSLDGGVLFHCGPIVVRDGDGWRLTAAGPTTSARTEPYLPGIIAGHGLRGVIGKGGMGAKTLAACAEHGCVYFSAVGGCAQLLAAAVRRVAGVHFLAEFGSPEAVWVLEVEDMPLLVTMDSHGNNLHRDIAELSRRRLQERIA